MEAAFPKMMKAAVYESFGGPITVRNVPVPNVPDDGVVLQVKATGVCRSDWHGWKGHDGDIRAFGLPFCPGHEVSGIVVEVGKDVQNFHVGDRVAVPFILSCGSCRHCTNHRRTICQAQQQPGFTQWGSFAEYLALPRADGNLQRLPDSVSFVQAAALGCRFTTAYRAIVQQGKVQRNTSVAIFGVGGVGLSCVMIAQAQGAYPILAIDVSSSALEKAKSVGATHALRIHTSNDSMEDIQSEVYQLLKSNEGADVTVDAAGFASTSQAAVYCTRPGGRMIQVGLPSKSPSIPMNMVAGKELELIGSHGFDTHALRGLLEMVASKQLDPAVLVQRHVTLEQGCQALQDMEHTSPLGIVMITKFSEYDDMFRATKSRL